MGFPVFFCIQKNQPAQTVWFHVQALLFETYLMLNSISP